MNSVENQVYETLTNLKSLDKLTELFCSHLNYGYRGDVVSRRGWKEQVADSIRDLQLVGTHDDFHVIFCEIERLLLGLERPIINQILKNHPYCLVVFSDPIYRNWHFVNIKYDEKAKNRRLFRRIVIGPDERLHTAAQRISMLDVPDESITALDLQREHDKAFDVEEVTKEFFNTFVDMFHLLRKELAENNPSYKERTDEEAQILLDRLMFLYFIQKKGWLDGNKNYLYQKFLDVEHRHSNGFTFYKDVLLPLFQALSSSDPKFRKHLGDIPFLNGGLFEVSPFHSKLPFNLKIPNKVFRCIFNELLEKFNFTVREDTPLDVEVAIDPEMLGKVFENLILQLEKDRDLRKITGSYYTPRVIVNFMCQQSLKEYLSNEWQKHFVARPVETGKLPLKNTSKQREIYDAMLDKQEGEHKRKLKALLQFNPADQLDDEDVVRLERTISSGEASLLKGIIQKAYVLDPAVGSGAFLVGMLHEMIALIKLLDVREHGLESIQCKNYDYELKRALIENCLYGVDIQEQAVRICELRLWLSLVVDYERESGEEVPPLPNLSYKVRCGDSLIEKLFGHNVQLDKLVRTNKGRQLIDEIREDKESYFLTRDIREKNRKELSVLAKQCELVEMLIKEKRYWVEQSGIQSGLFGETAEERKQKEEKDKELRELDNILYQARNTRKKVQAMLHGKIPFSLDDIHRLRQNLGLSFIWKLDFAEVFKEKGGFDISIANPPYLTFSRVTGSEHKNKLSDKIIKESLRKYFPNSAEYKLSTYAIFMNLGIAILHERGTMSFVIPDSFLIGRYFSKLRKYIIDKCKINKIVLFKEDFWEHGTIGLPVVILASRDSNKNSRNTHYVETNLAETVKDFSRGIFPGCKYEQKYFKRIRFNRFRLFFNTKDKEFTEIVEKNSIEASEILDMHVGIRSKVGYKQIYDSEKKGDSWKKGLVHGSEVIRYKINWAGNYINVDPKLLWAGGFNKRIVKQNKLLMRKTGNDLIVALDREGFFHLDILHAIVRKNSAYDLRYIMAILNSELMSKYYRLITLSLERVLAQTNIETIMQLPIYPASLGNQMKICRKVDEIMSLMDTDYSDPEKKSHIARISAEIDKMIYLLYGLG